MSDIFTDFSLPQGVLALDTMPLFSMHNTQTAPSILTPPNQNPLPLLPKWAGAILQMDHLLQVPKAMISPDDQPPLPPR